MTRLTRRAFTLVELLVVMSVIAVLVALLMPGLATVWKTVHVTQCMSNLGTLYKAQQAWRNENNSTLFAGGGDWAVKLASYVTNDSVFNCPEGWESSQGSGGSGSWSGGGGGSSEEDETSAEEEGRPEDFIGDSFSFDVYDGPSFQNKLWNVSINSEWARRTQVGANDYRYQIEDLGYIGGGDRDFRDIDVVVSFTGSIPSEVTIIQGKHGSQAYRFDLIINGKVAVHDIDSYASTHNVGEYVPPDQGTWDNPSTGSAYGKAIYVGHYWKQSDYGLSRGSYEILERDVPAVDSKLFLILDYGKSLADYSKISTDDPWSKYFFTDVEAWDSAYNVSGELSWRKYFSLRHFERANVLFCDGHVEGLSADDLRQTNPLWKYTGL